MSKNNALGVDIGLYGTEHFLYNKDCIAHLSKYKGARAGRGHAQKDIEKVFSRSGLGLL